jgi:hypothetical protein
VFRNLKKPAADKRYFKVPNDIFTTGLTKYELLVFVYLLHLQNDKQITFPGYENIAKCCAINRGKARKIVNGLIEKDIIRKQMGTQSYRKNHSSLYIIVLDDKHHLKQL